MPTYLLLYGFVRFLSKMSYFIPAVFNVLMINLSETLWSESYNPLIGFGGVVAV